MLLLLFLTKQLGMGTLFFSVVAVAVYAIEHQRTIVSCVVRTTGREKATGVREPVRTTRPQGASLSLLFFENVLLVMSSGYREGQVKHGIALPHELFLRGPTGQRLLHVFLKGVAFYGFPYAPQKRLSVRRWLLQK